MLSYNCRSFSLITTQLARSTHIAMHVRGAFNTRDIPDTLAMLAKHLPGVLQTTCFNRKNLPFHKEVHQTELGHLFEHILLEYLCVVKEAGGFTKMLFTGKTHWDWRVDKKGLFHITVDIGYEDVALFLPALAKTISLTEMLMQTATRRVIS